MLNKPVFFYGYMHGIMPVGQEINLHYIAIIDDKNHQSCNYHIA